MLSRRDNPRANMSNATPVKLPRKCEISKNGKGIKSFNHINLFDSVGNAPEMRRIAPPQNAATVNILGTRREIIFLA